MPHKLFINEDKVIVEFEGIEVLEAFERRLVFSLSNVVSVTTGSHPWIEGFRISGAGLPGVVKEGRYIVNGKKVFFAMRHPDFCVTIEFRNEEYDVIVVEVDNKERVAKEIMEAKKTYKT
ncbi:MAG: hypothetical protein QXX17_00670 [Conexivisphaerales archaeon]